MGPHQLNMYIHIYIQLAILHSISPFWPSNEKNVHGQKWRQPKSQRMLIIRKCERLPGHECACVHACLYMCWIQQHRIFVYIFCFFLPFYCGQWPLMYRVYRLIMHIVQSFWGTEQAIHHAKYVDWRWRISI